MKNILIKCCFLAVFLSPISFADAPNKGQCKANGIDYDIAAKFVSNLKTALNQKDKKTVATLISWPLRVNTAPGKFYTIKNTVEFANKYDTLFDSSLIKAINIDGNIFCNYQGAMIAGGIWFNTDNNTGKIFVINK